MRYHNQLQLCPLTAPAIYEHLHCESASCHIDCFNLTRREIFDGIIITFTNRPVIFNYLFKWRKREMKLCNFVSCCCRQIKNKSFVLDSQIEVKWACYSAIGYFSGNSNVFFSSKSKIATLRSCSISMLEAANFDHLILYLKDSSF